MNTYPSLKTFATRSVRRLAAPALLGLTVLTAPPADASDEQEEGEGLTIVFQTTDSLVGITEATVALAPSAAELEEVDDAQRYAAVLQSNATLAALHDVLSMSPEEIWNSPDPVLALATVRWATEFAGAYGKSVQGNGPLLEGLHDLPEGDASGPTSVEGALGRLLAAAGSTLAQDDSDSLWIDVLVDVSPPGFPSIVEGKFLNDGEGGESGWTFGPKEGAWSVQNGSADSEWPLPIFEDPPAPPPIFDGNEEEDDAWPDPIFDDDEGGEDEAPLPIFEDPPAPPPIFDGNEDEDDAWPDPIFDDGEGGDTDGGEDSAEGGEPEDDDAKSTPCEPHVDGCGGGEGDLPEDEDDGTTQPGLDGGNDDGFTLPPVGTGLGPLILTDPDSTGSPVVIVVRPPTYGLTQPNPEDPQMWETQRAVFEKSVGEVTTTATKVAASLSEVCGRPGCR